MPQGKRAENWPISVWRWLLGGQLGRWKSVRTKDCKLIGNNSSAEDIWVPASISGIWEIILGRARPVGSLGLFRNRNQWRGAWGKIMARVWRLVFQRSAFMAKDQSGKTGSIDDTGGGFSPNRLLRTRQNSHGRQPYLRADRMGTAPRQGQPLSENIKRQAAVGFGDGSRNR